ncbi:MAG TPA: hypothetical protein VFP34_03115 [Microlunatus sp.]|nr:hypothetical protein [Microlunatus sp.]
MTNPSGWTNNPNGGSPSTTTVAKEQASDVKDTAVDAGKHVAATAKDEVANVAAETKQQAKSLLSSVTDEVQTQASSQQQKIAAAVHGLSKELGGMASGSAGSGPMTDLAHQASRKGGEIAHWLEDKEPRDVLTEVTAYARRRPVTFLVICGLAGVLAGRVTRGAVAANTSLDSNDSDHTTTRALTTYQVPAEQRAPVSLVDKSPTSYEDNRAGAIGYVSPALTEARSESDLMR